MANIERKKYAPPPLSGDIPCSVCGNPGSLCPDCGVVFCATCNKNPHLIDGHAVDQHMTPPEESEADALRRENASLQMLLDRRRRRALSVDVDTLRTDNAALKAALADTL